jgi:hypothetical protein
VTSVTEEREELSLVGTEEFGCFGCGKVPAAGPGWRETAVLLKAWKLYRTLNEMLSVCDEVAILGHKEEWHSGLHEANDDVAI